MPDDGGFGLKIPQFSQPERECVGLLDDLL